MVPIWNDGHCGLGVYDMAVRCGGLLGPFASRPLFGPHVGAFQSIMLSEDELRLRRRYSCRRRRRHLCAQRHTTATGGAAPQQCRRAALS